MSVLLALQQVARLVFTSAELFGSVRCDVLLTAASKETTNAVLL